MNIFFAKNNECCPKIVVYTEDFYMPFGNCNNHSKNCNCPETDGFKNILEWFFSKNKREISLF